MNNIEVLMIASAKLEIQRLERQARGPLSAEYLNLHPSEIHRGLLRQGWMRLNPRRAARPVPDEAPPPSP